MTAFAIPVDRFPQVLTACAVVFPKVTIHGMPRKNLFEVESLDWREAG